VAYRSTARRCDWDNIGKTISDALNSLAWEDDYQVDDARVIKRIDRARPRAEVWVAELADGLEEPAL
jgi:Holliday junction resolvase RusA-like endonuclease